MIYQSVQLSANPVKVAVMLIFVFKRNGRILTL